MKNDLSQNGYSKSISFALCEKNAARKEYFSTRFKKSTTLFKTKILTQELV